MNAFLNGPASSILPFHHTKKRRKAPNLLSRPAPSPIDQTALDRICDAHRRLLEGADGGQLAILAGQDLSGLSLAGRDLRDADFSAAVLEGCDFTEADLSGARLTGASLAKANLSRCQLDGADLRGCDFTGANLSAARCQGADFRELAATGPVPGSSPTETRQTRLDQASLSGSVLDKARLAGVSARGALFDETSLAGARFNRADLEGAVFVNALFSATGFGSANLTDADFRNCDEAAADLSQATTRGLLTGALPDQPDGPELAADTDPRTPQQRVDDHIKRVQTAGKAGEPARLDGCDLRQVDLPAAAALTALQAVRANLAGLDLRAAQLQGARLTGADMRRCDLRGADLRGAELSGTNLAHADLRGALLDPLVLGADRQIPVTLKKANLRFADLRDCDLSSALTEGADTEHARR